MILKMPPEQIVSDNPYKLLEFVINGLDCTSPNDILEKGVAMKYWKWALDTIKSLDTEPEHFSGKFDINLKKEGLQYIIECDSKDYSTIQKEYNKYNRRIYYTKDFLFDTKQIDGKVCINMHQISTYLGYASPQYLVKYHSMQKSNFKTVDGVYADILNFQKLLFGNHLRKPKAKDLCSWFPYENQTMLVSHPPEVNVLSDIISFFRRKCC
jgi:hypothetical protein